MEHAELFDEEDDYDNHVYVVHVRRQRRPKPTTAVGRWRATAMRRRVAEQWRIQLRKYATKARKKQT